jgi:hypothetical protein
MRPPPLSLLASWEAPSPAPLSPPRDMATADMATTGMDTTGMDTVRIDDLKI